MSAARLLLPLLLSLAACTGSVKDGSDAEDGYASLLAVDPPRGGQGQTISVALEATDSIYSYEGDLIADFGDGITVDSVEVADGWTARATITIEPDAELGGRDVSVDMDGSAFSLTDGFEVIAESFEIDPDSGRMGETVDVTFLGHNTSWTSGVTWPTLGDDIEVLEFTVLSESLAAATVVIGPDALPGWRDVSMGEGAEYLTLYDGFKVDRVGIAATFDPTEVPQGDTVEFTVKGRGTDFSGDSVLTFLDAFGENADIEVDSITVIDAENFYGRMSASNAAALGPRDVLVTTDDESVLIPDAFEVIGGDLSLEDVAISLGFYVVRAIDNSTGEISESVIASCTFFIPLDPQCPPDPEDTGAECTDGEDNDGDGFVDCKDSDCSSAGVCPGPSPYDVNVLVESPDNGEWDCPYPSTVGAGDYVWLESATNVVTLEKVEDPSSGTVYYYGYGLTMDDYVPGEVYDLHTQGEDGGVGEELLPEVLPTVPADWSMVSPDLWGNYTHDRAEDFVYEWTPAETYADAIFAASVSGTLEETGEGGAVSALPWDDGIHTFTSDQMSQLAAGPGNFTAYSVIKGPYFGLPDSIYQTNQASSYIYLQAYLVLE